MNRVILYRRVSMEQADAGDRHGLQVQADALALEAGRRGWTDAEWVTDDGVSGKVEPADRPSLGPVLRGLGRGDMLVVAKVDRLSRSLLHFAGLMDWASRRGIAIVCLDMGVDTTTPAGRMLANVMASFAQYEREIISDRTRAAHLHRLAEDPSWVQRRDEVWRQHDAGASQRRIAVDLDVGKETVARILRRPRPV